MDTGYLADIVVNVAELRYSVKKSAYLLDPQQFWLLVENMISMSEARKRGSSHRHMLSCWSKMFPFGINIRVYTAEGTTA